MHDAESGECRNISSQKQKVIEAVRSPFHEALLSKSYTDLKNRIQPSGYFPESSTGAYGGMYCRTIGALARLFLATDHTEPIERMLRFCLNAMSEVDMERVPHTIDPEKGVRIDDVDQVDGQAHVILAWALLSLRDGQSQFQGQTYGTIAKLMDRTCLPPYLSCHTRWRIEPGLVLNTHLEHSREHEYWHAFDFLTQSFVAAALRAMKDVAIRRDDNEHAERWNTRLRMLEENINSRMVRDFDGQQIYAEMLLPTGREPAVFPGISWLNLAPVPAGWDGVDQTLFEQTIDAWHRHAELRWNDLSLTVSDWLPEKRGHQIHTKVFGWDIVYLARRGQWKRVLDILSFLKQVNGDGFLSEAFVYNIDEDQWSVRDRGNGEQAAWFCWGLIECRKILGLDALPSCVP